MSSNSTTTQNTPSQSPTQISSTPPTTQNTPTTQVTQTSNTQTPQQATTTTKGNTATTQTTAAQTTTSPSTTIQPTTITFFSTNSDSGSTQTIVKTSTAAVETNAATGAISSSSSSGSAALQTTTPKATASSGLHGGGLVAVAVVVPIVAVAFIVLAAIFLWRKRKQRKDAEELRRKEVEEYGYNPNNDPTLPAVGGGSAGHDGPFEMREDGGTGYRGWGTTAVSSGRKASTTLSGGNSAGGIGMAYSEGTSPTAGAHSDTRSDNPLMEGHPSEMEALGAMGPATAGNRNGDINRGPSNASSSYSAAGRSDGSGEMGGGQFYNNQYDAGNPYNNEAPYGSPPRAEMSGQPVIRDVQARRNTRIENPAHFPQQSAGIAQNF